MRRTSPAKLIVGGIAALLASLLAVHKIPHGGSYSKTTAAVQHSEIHHVVYVYDGDTIKLNDGERVRLIGIDTPESRQNDKLEHDVRRLHKDKQTLLSMGHQASVFTKDLLQGKDVRLELDVEPRDRYGRLLAYVYLTDGTFVNEKIIRQGYAYPLTIPPDVRYADKFKQWFDEARENNRGLWRKI